MFSHLKCLNGYFYFRMRVPADIEQQLGRREIQKTLRTNNSKIARQDVKSLASKAEKMFRLIRSGVLTPEQIADHIESQFPSKNDRIAIVKPKLRNPFYLDTESDPIWTPERGNSYLPFGEK